MNYEEIICDANNLYRAYKVSVKTSKWKETTQKFMLNFLRYIFSIQDDLMNRTLQNGPTQEFTLFERGRVRPITSIQIRDRIIRHVLCDEVLLPEVKKHIIYDNCASIKGRGISRFGLIRLITFPESVKLYFICRNLYVLEIFTIRVFFLLIWIPYSSAI